MHPNRAAGGQNPAPPGTAALRRASSRPVLPAAELSGGRRVRRRTVAARSTVRRFSLRTTGDSRTNQLVLLDDVLDDRLARSVLRAASLLGDDLVQMADERIALGILCASRPQIDGDRKST